MIFVDTNIFMYAAGAEHPYKMPCVRFFESAIRDGTEMAINCEVLQEILYRYWAIRRADQGYSLYDYTRKICSWILPISTEETDLARELMQKSSNLGPRDALHVASMTKHRIATIVSYDRHFDDTKRIKRIEPD